MEGIVGDATDVGGWIEVGITRGIEGIATTLGAEFDRVGRVGLISEGSSLGGYHDGGIGQ
jgi:hypothetical protein